jgi:hypothetical protein
MGETVDLEEFAGAAYAATGYGSCCSYAMGKEDDDGCGCGEVRKQCCWKSCRISPSSSSL